MTSTMATAKINPETREIATRLGMKGHHFHEDSRGFIIVKRTGIEYIAGKLHIDAELTPFLEWSNPEDGRYVIRCDAKRPMGDGTWIKVTTFGEVSKANNRNQYPIAMAEKRALSRAILKLAGLYKAGAYGEDEIDE